MNPRVVLHPRHPRGVAEAFRRLDSIVLSEPGPEDVQSEVAEAEVMVTFVWRPDYLTDRLRWVQSVSAGYDQFPLDVFAERGVALTSARGVHVIPMAEHAFALMLAMTRGVGVAMRDAVSHTWRPRMGEEISGRTLGILGLGEIGEELAGRAKAWGMKVIGTKRTVTGYAGNADVVLVPGAAIEVFRAADIVVSLLPGGDETFHAVGAAELAALGEGWFVSLGRGSAVDQDAVVEALEAGTLRGAAFDVTETEPLPEDSALWDHPRVVITPHVGGLSPGYGPRLAALFERNLAGYLGSDEWATRVV